MSFKSSFERSGEKENLDYDDSAFYYFGLAMLNVILIPTTYYLILKPVLFGEWSVSRYLKNCKCEICTKRLEKRIATYRYSWLNMQFMINLIVLAFFWFLCYQCFDIVKDIEPLKSFVPHELLGVDITATEKEVKKAYRKLSREKHPDKNPDNPEAVNEFIQITKAYTVSIVFALTLF